MILAKEKISYADYQDYSRKTRKRVKKVRKFKKNPKLLFALLIIATFVLGLFLASKYAQLAISGYQIGKMKDNLAKLQMENEQLSLQVTKLQSLDRIEKVAVEKLGMMEPEGVQYIAVEPINVKTGSNMATANQVKTTEAKATDGNRLFNAITTMVGSFTGKMTAAEAGGR